MKLIVGVIGRKRSGKGSLVGMLARLARDDGFTVYAESCSRLLVETLDAWGIPTIRHNLQRLPQIMNVEYGENTFSKAIGLRIAKHEQDIFFLDGLRWYSDIELLHSFATNALCYVIADPEVRYNRSLASIEKADEANASFEEFIRLEQAPNELLIEELGSQADFQIVNNHDDLALLEPDAQKFYTTVIKPALL